MKKDLNLNLTWAVVLLIIALCTLSVTYGNHNFELEKEFEQKREEISTISEEYNYQKNRYEQASAQLEIKTEREDNFNEDFLQIRKERDYYKSKVEILKKEIKELEKQLED